MKTYLGKTVNVFNFTENDVLIDDIARSMAYTWRYRGHTRSPVSDAMHCLLVREIVRLNMVSCGYPVDRCHSWEMLLGALIHDSSEAYLVDPVSSFKKHLMVKTPDGLMMAYRSFEQRILHVIHRNFGIEHIIGEEMIERADKQAAEWEMKNCRCQPTNREYVFPSALRWKNITDPERAEELFLRTFYADRSMICCTKSAQVAGALGPCELPTVAGQPFVHRHSMLAEILS